MASEKTPNPERAATKRSEAVSKVKRITPKKVPKDTKKSAASKESAEGITSTKVELTPNTKRLLRVRKIKQQQRPRFRKPESWRWGRIPSHWRFPHGIDNKTIRKWKCGVKTPIIGYRGPRLVRGMHPCGLHEMVVNNLNDIEQLDPKIHCIKIGRRVGARKRMPIIEKLRKMQFKILNIGMSEKEFQEFEMMLQEKSGNEGIVEK
ncbi:MAG: 50S ribosomal protein L32 [Promethearchaeota archaeon CR_4]|nr:MAG: 50S ribosomal protein L32 [Candidatus Lokiarchaeota archaeon CR_4]